MGYRVAHFLLRSYWFVRRPSTSGALCALWHDGKILLVKNSYRVPHTLPGGYVRPREDPRVAAARELREEVGVRIDPERLEHVYHGEKRFEFRSDTLDIYEAELDEAPKLRIDNIEVVWAGFKTPAEARAMQIVPPPRGVPGGSLMAFRDEQEALRQRVNDLEERLDDAQGEIARLKGESTAAELEPGVGHSALLDRPLGHRLERSFQGELSTEAYERIAEILRRRLGLKPTQVGRRLEAGPFEIAYEDGVTRVEVRTSFRGTVTALVARTGLVGALGTLMSTGVLLDVAHVSPAHLLWIGPTLLVGSGLFFRSRAQKAVDRIRTDGVEPSRRCARSSPRIWPPRPMRPP